MSVSGDAVVYYLRIYKHKNPSSYYGHEAHAYLFGALPTVKESEMLIELQSFDNGDKLHVFKQRGRSLSPSGKHDYIIVYRTSSTGDHVPLFETDVCCIHQPLQSCIDCKEMGRSYFTETARYLSSDWGIHYDSSSPTSVKTNLGPWNRHPSKKLKRGRGNEEDLYEGSNTIEKLQSDYVKLQERLSRLEAFVGMYGK